MKQCTMNCGPSAWDKRSREQMMSECDDCVTEPCNPAEDGVCEALECCKHGVDDGACKECYDDTALLRQAWEALAYWLEHGETPGAHDMIQRTHDALQERLK